MESLSRLREILVRVLDSGVVPHGEHELFDELMVRQSRLLRLLDVGPRNPQEQKEIESGRLVMGGKQVAVNSDFARQSIFLSQQLDCSERSVAELLYNVMAENPNIDPVRCLEVTIAEFHQRRRDLVDCVDLLFKAVEASMGPNISITIEHLADFVITKLIQGINRPDDAYGVRIFKQIDGFDAVLVKADNARKSAGSATVVSSGPQGTLTLGYDVLNSRYESLKYERRQLANAYATLSRVGYWGSNEIKLTVDWLAQHANHAITYYMLTATLSAFDTADPQSGEWERRQKAITDKATTDFMSRSMTPSPPHQWQDPGLKATILLKWTLIRTEARHRDPNLEDQEGFRAEELETQVWNAVQGDAFVYLPLAVLQLQRKRSSVPVASLVNTLSLTNEQQEQRTVPPDDFKPYVLTAFESLVRLLITHASSGLRKIKQRQEDLASVRTDRARTASRFAASLASFESDKPTPPPRHDIAMLYSFIGLLYSFLPPERALQFWGSGPQPDALRTSYLEYAETTAGRLPAFLQWAVWSTPTNDITMSTALYDMLGGLAKGQQCSELAYNFMARGGGEVIPGSMLPSSSSAGPSVSWAAIFGILESWASSATSARSQQQQHLGFSTTLGSSFAQSAPSQPPPSQQIPIGPKDVLLAQSFLRLLSTVVTYSVAVRITISGHAHFRAIPTLVSLIPLGIPLELKGALFETLAAFCEPGAGVPGVEICKAVWTLMERLEVINVRVTPTGPFGGVMPLKGVEAELEEVEAVHKLYPSTIPFLKLLSTLIHTPKRVPFKDRLVDAQPINTIPETLGQPYRHPGVGPFTAFIVDNVFANIPNREYSRRSDRWQTNDLCLCYIERALAGFDLESLVNNPEGTSLKGENLVPLLVHPGYDVMKRVLTRTPLQASILSYIVEGVDGFEKGFADDEPYFATTIIRVLRIVHRILEIQDIFLDVLVPLLTEVDYTPIVGQVHSRSYYTKFDQELTFGSQYIPALAAYIAFPNHPELVLLSLSILSTLAASTSSSNLATLIDRSSESERILAGFVDIMGIESLEDVADTEALAEEITGAGAPDIDETPPLAQAIRLAALDLLIQETEASRPYPTIAHFLLFGSVKNDQQIQDPHALGARRTSVHVLFDLVNAGVPRPKGKGKERDHDPSTPLFITLPELAERCYRVIYQLCTHPRTSDSTARYLRTREDFFARQLASVPFHAPHTPKEPYIEVQYRDGARVITTVPSLASFLRLRSCIFDLVALDLHILTSKGHVKGVSELLDILFGNAAEYETEDEDFHQFQEIGQSHMRIIEFLQSLMFDWSDSLAVEPIDLQFLGSLNLHSCIRTDATGCEIIDRTALLSLLAAAKRALHAQGRVVTPAQAEQLQREAAYILESAVVENHRREVAHSVAGGYEAWRRMLDLTLTKCFDRLPHDRRENMLFDLLHVLPMAIRSQEVEESTAVLLSEAVLSSITKLREDRRQQVIAQSAGGNAEAGSLPAERLFAILRTIVEAITDNNRVELVRGNLYAALVNYVHLITSRNDGDAAFQKGDNLALSLAASTTREDFLFDGNQSVASLDRLTRSTSSDRSLQAGSLAVMKGSMERLVGTVARDAIDGTEVWKTVAFMLLDSLVQLSEAERPQLVLSALTRHGILSNFVRGLKESDSRLLSVLKPDPDDLNPLYVYEAKMSFFIRMTQTRAGAERLLEAQLVPVLAQCDFIDARPEEDQSFMDRDSFLPSAIQRYHQLFMPTLQLVDGMLATLGNKHGTVVNQASEFLTSHSATITILLKNDGDYAPLALLEEIHLIVTLAANVLPSVPKTEMVSFNSGFGAIHAAILGLATRCLGGGRCFAHVVPRTDTEMEWARVYAFGHGSQTEFELRVRQRERLLRKSIVAYLGAASDFTEPEITLVLSPITTQPRYDEQALSQFLTTIPTIGDALEALNTLCTELAHTLKQISDLDAELAAPGHIGVNNIGEVVKGVHASLLHDLDITQKRQLICDMLENIKRDATKEARVLLDTTEMLLLLIWRHVQHYTSPAAALPTAPPPLSSSALFHSTKSQGTMGMNTAMRFLTAPDPENFKAEVGRRLGPALSRLEGLDLHIDSEVRRQSQPYVEIMARRLRESVGLLHDSSGREEGSE
ncbi:putative nuclear pore complex scaffold, nucleoporins 186/192/205 [Lyophyllum shimeji]|uniref:Nuclear pore complex scaffold, nucleoporins 186/192/205 n=1 Tax=Lyophyllum shimeji TaxID=47721 RepID=A0A9P3PZ12_LYOSH|nr:putative nuclear pore complex scaffold, nucleoporins 186/192/205 [Lyophyllum shimeji]